MGLAFAGRLSSSVGLRNNSDRNSAHGIAHLMRMNAYRQGYSQRHACGLVGMEPRVYRYRPS
ncbi:hypothetical protein BQ8794_240325 [Mesorhizobium prunaredense]|uniref:Transposase n=1 Tax=Mesorhizobium prunaredense TaxID=1631249 RepID=A0A1R3V893_9HYPH|nr:hypothetical protein BQ8794_240325 [Mesorhizobium prunaredense]